MPNSPRAHRPIVPDSYGVPSTTEGLLPWSHVVGQIVAARNFWAATVRPDGQPHVVPVWGIWLDDVFFHGGGGDTRKARNLELNPRLTVHLESGDDVVILEGVAEKFTEQNADEKFLARIDEAYTEKYGEPHGTPVWALRLDAAFAWSGFPATVTRWAFDGK